MAVIQWGFAAGALVLALAAGGSAHADPCKAIPDSGKLPSYLTGKAKFSGQVTYVGDGDGLCVAVGPGPDKWVEVRLADFYAPELSSLDGLTAKTALAKIVMGRTVTCTADHRSYDRIVAVCMLEGVSVGDRMRASGIAEGGNGKKANAPL